jgi:hypothetical protein
MGGIRASAPALPAAPPVAAPKAACFDFAAMIKRGKAEKWAARSERLAAALRENLKRRKAQLRGRNAEDLAAADANLAAAPDFRRNPGGKSGGGPGGPATGRGG